MDLWRLSRFADLAGTGGLHLDARWHTAGQPVVYLAETVPGAILEVLVHLLEAGSIPPDYRLLRVDVSGAANSPIRVESIFLDQLATDWQQHPAVTQFIGNRWLAERQTAMLRVPSAIAPATYNVLLNPLHPEASRTRVVEEIPFTWDERLHAMVERCAATRRRRPPA